MTITSLPSRAALDLGAVLSNIRTAVSNELSAVNVEKIKDWIIAIATEVGLSDGSTAGSLNARVKDLEAAGGGPTYPGTWAGALFRTIGSPYPVYGCRRYNQSASLPEVTDDETAGYGQGSIWVVTEDGDPRYPYICTSATAGAALWRRLGNGDGSGSSNGFFPTSISGSSASLPISATDYPLATVTTSVPGGITLSLPAGGIGVGAIVYAGGYSGGITLSPNGTDTINGANAAYTIPVSDFADAGGYSRPWWLVVGNGSGGWNILSPTRHTQATTPVTSTGTIPDEDVISVDTSSGAVVLNLRPVVTGKARKWEILKVNAGANGISLHRAGSEYVQGALADYTLPDSTSTAYPSWTLYRDNAGNYRVA